MRFDDIKFSRFKPLKIIKNPWAQTIVASFNSPNEGRMPPKERCEPIELSDGDRLLAVFSAPSEWKQEDGVVIMFHGLTGSSESSYMIRLGVKFLEQKKAIYRINLRGCGRGKGLAKSIYHSGRSADARQVLEYVKKRFPQAPITLFGVSLGANILLKMAGEDGSTLKDKIEGIVAVSPPADLSQSSLRMQQNGRLLDRYFTQSLLHTIAESHPDFSIANMRYAVGGRALRLRDIDEYFVSELCNFADAEDYYMKSSSIGILANIKVKTLIISALDDPVVCTEALTTAKLAKSIDLRVTEQGGHVGFLGEVPGDPSYRWLDQAVMTWLSYLWRTL